MSSLLPDSPRCESGGCSPLGRPALPGVLNLGACGNLRSARMSSGPIDSWGAVRVESSARDTCYFCVGVACHSRHDSESTCV